MEEVLPKRKFGWIGIILGVIGAVFILLSLYLLLFAPFTANSKYTILLRKDFYEKVLEKTLLPARLPYQAFVRDVTTSDQGEQIYEYGMMGRFVQLDTGRNLLTLRDMMGKTWFFDFTTQLYSGETSSIYQLMMVEVKIANDGSEQSGIVYCKYDLNHPEATQPYFHPGDIVMIVWRDKRRLPEILENNTGDPRSSLIPLSVVPNGGNGLMPIRKIVGEGE